MIRSPAAAASAVLLAVPLAALCCAAPEPTPLPCGVEVADTELYDGLFEEIAARQKDGEPLYRSWPLFPGTERLHRIGLPVHGRWTTVYVDPDHAYPFLENAIANGHPQPLELPPGSIVVKENYRSSEGASAIDPEYSTLEVLTVMYKPFADETAGTALAASTAGSPYDFPCATANLEPYNGDPQTGCLGGRWFYAFYKVEADQPTVCDTSEFGKFLNANVNSGAGSFCVHCHSPAFDTDYLRILDDDLNPRSVAPGPPPNVPAAQPPACDSALRPTLPADVPLDPLAVWAGPGGPEAAQSMFDCFSWRTFVALNWPADPERRGQPDRSRSIRDPQQGPTVWQTYFPVYALFQPGDVGWQPPPFQDPGLPDNPSCRPEKGQMVLSLSSKARDIVNETGQAFAGTFGTLHDRNEKLVRYEVLVNEVEYDYVAGNGLASTPELTPAGPAGVKADFPFNGTDRGNSIEIKSAWKQLCTDPGCQPVDDPADYLTTEALIYEGPEQGCSEPVPVGLVGLHVAVKTFWAPQWVWATFEHRSNAPTRGTDEVHQGGWSFFDDRLPEPANCFKEPFLVSPAGCPNVVLNRFAGAPPPPPPLPPVDQPDQITRLVAIDAQAKALNDRFQGELAGTPFANYVLVDAQWPLHGQAGSRDDPRPVMKSCEGNALGDNCFVLVPEFLRNSVIESYMTTYVQDGDHPRQISNRSCLECHLIGANGSYVWLDAVANRVPVTGTGE